MALGILTFGYSISCHAFHPRRGRETGTRRKRRPRGGGRGEKERRENWAVFLFCFFPVLLFSSPSLSPRPFPLRRRFPLVPVPLHHLPLGSEDVVFHELLASKNWYTHDIRENARLLGTNNFTYQDHKNAHNVAVISLGGWRIYVMHYAAYFVAQLLLLPMFWFVIRSLLCPI